MYQLTLTADERRAIDWIGNRYDHGTKLYRLLWRECTTTPNDVDWDADCDITFTLPEFVAWEIARIGYECDHGWDCFAERLSNKLTDFCYQVI